MASIQAIPINCFVPYRPSYRPSFGKVRKRTKNGNTTKQQQKCLIHIACSRHFSGVVRVTLTQVAINVLKYIFE